ncbi:uncharacterized protein LOC108101468 [Drosophila ficusphila]|uniref:uncharacterized protein LOC108101468 n=1 Tax=Drosophila ficusphila TaxID=30025 RepID=UPI0007E7A194|nr:uncharacterized protein LOC108101468 [Drosophila ficusphila]
MFLVRAMIGLPILKAETQLQHRRQMSERLPYHRRPVPVKLRERQDSWTDPKRPPFLLVKSFLNLRHMDADNGKNISRVTEELSFQPHRTLFINVLQISHRGFSEAESLAEMMVKNPLVPNSVPES